MKCAVHIHLFCTYERKNKVLQKLISNIQNEKNLLFVCVCVCDKDSHNKMGK